MGVHGGNMAAVDPSESPKRQKSLPEEVNTSGEKAGAVESRCGLNQKDEPRHNKPAESPADEQRAGDDGSCVASHSGVRVESSAGVGQKTCNSPEDLTSAEKMAEARGGERRAFDWSETEDREAKTRAEGNGTCDPSSATESAGGMQRDARVDDNVTADAERIKEKETSHPEEEEMKKEEEEEKKSAETGPVEELAGDVGAVEEVAGNEADRGEDANSTAKPKKCRLVCKECGKRFTRRETFNLHRHLHEDELTPLTCKECGLTFQHRSSLIKHRNEHKEKEEVIVPPKKATQTKTEGRFQCAECEVIFSMVDKLRDHSCCNVVEKPYHCPLCRQEFQFKVSVTKHMMLHSQDSIFTCRECGQTFPNSMSLRYHQRCHAALKPYECPKCGLVFKHYSVMEDHRRKHTDHMRSHLCNICGKTFKYSSLLHQHQYLHTGQKPFRCPECGRRFAFAQNMKAHCRQHRLLKNKRSAQQPCQPAPTSAQEAVRGPGKENAHQSDDPKQTFDCPLCPETDFVPANLRAHMLVHEAEHETLERTHKPPKEDNKMWEKGHTCPHCPSVYYDESSLDMHLSSVHNSVAQPLEKTAKPSKNLLTPLSSDNVQGKWRSDGISLKSYKCSECGKTFRHRSVLELHMRIHSKDRPYQCKVCGKGFRFSSYLQQHGIIHTGQKPYKCPDCGKDFAFLQNMKTHQKLHQEKPFRCTSCRKGYSDETQLQQHMLSHSGDKPHKCELCDKSFGLAYLLRDHMNTHTGDRPHRCEECDKSFSWFSSLLVHQKTHARKPPGFPPFNYLPPAARMRGRGSRVRRGGRLTWGWSRPLGSSGMVSPQQPPCPVSPLRGAELHRLAGRPQPPVLAPRTDSQGRRQKELPRQPKQWKVDGGEVMLASSSEQQQRVAPQQTPFDSPPQPGLQRGPGSADSPLITQSGPTSAQSSESLLMKETAAAFVSSLKTAAPNKSGTTTTGELCGA
ncbi:zinc finger protein 11 isoform X3 [Pseudoliparis swirei]|uniref:zinc finger protein 11 isoform X3 n=1 Tax=Pseudoliparis swirei TaxID=2059687 RepID=UPI0024BE652C|nr:zinc finger protein 11 isoform X3 [Pseudoliparis swirei]